MTISIISMNTTLSPLSLRLLEGSDTSKLLKSEGGGSAKLVDHSFPYYSCRRATINQFAPSEECLFLENLSNGGVKGEGLAVLKMAIETSMRIGKLLVLAIHGSQRLKDWYASTGLVKQIDWEFWYAPETGSIKKSKASDEWGFGEILKRSLSGLLSPGRIGRESVISQFHREEMMVVIRRAPSGEPIKNVEEIEAVLASHMTISRKEELGNSLVYYGKPAHGTD